MAHNNARLTEKDLLAAQVDTSAASVILDLFEFGALKFSCHAIYVVTSNPSAAVIATANITINTDPTHPSQFNKTAHGFVTGLKVQATTAGTLAVPLAVSTDYFAIKIDANYFQLASSLANALAGIPIAITGVGVTSTTLTPVALAGASVTFNKSNNKTDWIAIQTATSISSSGSVMIENGEVAYRYLQVVKGLTAGIVNMKALVLVIGDAT